MMDEYDSLVESMGQVEADALVDERDKDRPFIDEWISADPGDEDAQYNESTGTMTLDITDGDFDLHPLDSVTVTVAVVETVDA